MGVEQRVEAVEDGATLLLGEHRALAAGADELHELAPPERLDVGEGRPLDGPVEPALVDARRRGGDAALAERALRDDRLGELRDPRLGVVARVPDERDPAAGP